MVSLHERISRFRGNVRGEGDKAHGRDRDLITFQVAAFSPSRSAVALAMDLEVEGLAWMRGLGGYQQWEMVMVVVVRIGSRSQYSVCK